MLPGDDASAPVEASQQFRDLAAPQFWDGEQKLGLEVARSLAVPDWVAWDIYLFYPPGVEWTDSGLPLPEGARPGERRGRGGEGNAALQGRPVALAARIQRPCRHRRGAVGTARIAVASRGPIRPAPC